MIWSTTMPLVAIGGLALIPLVLGLIARGGTVGQTVALVLLIPTSMLSIAVAVRDHLAFRLFTEWCVRSWGKGKPTPSMASHVRLLTYFKGR